MFLFPLLLTLQLIKLQHKKYTALWTQIIVYLGSFLAVTNPPVYDYQAFLNENLAKVCGVSLTWLAFQLLRPGSDSRRSRRHIRSLRREFLDQLSLHPRFSQSHFESLIYHRINQLNNCTDDQAKFWLLRWGVVLLNCSHIVWQLRESPISSAKLANMRDETLRDLHRFIGERGVYHASLDKTLNSLEEMLISLAADGGKEETALAAVLWRLYCSLSPLKQATPRSATLSH
ncbi:MAG: hypothetical protein XXXJIFNMEKO3_01299 [Candidatus Erwinia impunctatus]|nr:hypothetical protein XXXJIFNMEKO_01299 [Culicoides impunctatus]